MTEVQKIIEKWYWKLGFPEKYNEEFYQILEEIPIDASLRVDDADIWSPYGKENLLQYLYFTEQLHKQYQEKGIPDSIFIHTMQDIVNWTKTWSDVRGELWLEETQWLHRHFHMQLFALGRLQFFICSLWADIPEWGMAKGDTLIEVHIPAEGPLKYEDCLASFRMANVFFPKYFPDHPYQDYFCDSWLLDDSLKDYLRPDTNIMKFQSLSVPISKRPNNEILHCIFPKDTTEENLAAAVPTSSFAAKVKETVLHGGRFYSVMGKRSKLLDKPIPNEYDI